MKSIIILLAIAVCYSEAVETKTVAVRPKGGIFEFKMHISSKRKMLQTQKQIYFLATARDIVLEKSNDKVYLILDFEIY